MGVQGEKSIFMYTSDDVRYRYLWFFMIVSTYLFEKSIFMYIYVTLAIPVFCRMGVQGQKSVFMYTNMYLHENVYKHIQISICIHVPVFYRIGVINWISFQYFLEYLYLHIDIISDGVGYRYVWFFLIVCTATGTCLLVPRYIYSYKYICVYMYIFFY